MSYLINNKYSVVLKDSFLKGAVQTGKIILDVFSAFWKEAGAASSWIFHLTNFEAPGIVQRAQTKHRIHSDAKFDCL